VTRDGPWLEMPSEECARRPGASPLKRMAASWSGSHVGPTEYKVAARSSCLLAGSPRFEFYTRGTERDRHYYKYAVLALPLNERRIDTRRLVSRVPRCSLRGRSGARHPRHARAIGRAARGCGWLRSSHPLRCAPRQGIRQVGTEKQVLQSNGKAGKARKMT